MTIDTNVLLFWCRSTWNNIFNGGISQLVTSFRSIIYERTTRGVPTRDRINNLPRLDCATAFHLRFGPCPQLEARRNILLASSFQINLQCVWYINRIPTRDNNVVQNRIFMLLLIEAAPCTFCLPRVALVKTVLNQYDRVLYVI